jgi:hypothetical protein
MKTIGLLLAAVICSAPAFATNITGLILNGGSWDGANFGSNGQIWDTLPTGNWVLGLSNPGTSNPLLNDASTTSVNVPLGTYYTYNEPTFYGSHVRLTVQYSDLPTANAVFAVGGVGAWTRVSGAADINLGGTGITNVDKVGPGHGLSPSGTNDGVLQVQIGNAVPEPTSVALMLGGFAGLFAMRRRRR